jgi:hypothetical protein
MICLTVHVPLPRVQRVKQIPLNARTGRVSGKILMKEKDVLVRPIKLTNFAIIPLSYSSAKRVKQDMSRVDPEAELSGRGVR